MFFFYSQGERICWFKSVAICSWGNYQIEMAKCNRVMPLKQQWNLSYGPLRQYLLRSQILPCMGICDFYTVELGPLPYQKSVMIRLSGACQSYGP